MITKKGSRIKTGVFFCDRVLVFASHIRYNDRKLFQRERRKTVMKKIVFATGNVKQLDMAKVGLILNLFCIAIIGSMTYFVWL